ncbi:MAG: alginate lyase family protein, partial [Armatimonadota bacterium]
TLARAWWHTGDERYAQEAAEILRQWIEDAKVANVRRPTIHWRTLDTGIRLRIWPEVWLRLLRWEDAPDQVLVSMLKMFWHQADYLMEYHGGGNWLVTEKAGLLKTALLLPEFTRAEAWEDNALETLAEEIAHQTYPSGAQFELTPHYHMVSLRSFEEPLHLMRMNGRELPEVYRERLEAMHEYLLLVAKPDGRIPMLNDSDHGSVRGYMRDGAALFGREDMRYVATEGAEGTEPEFRSVALPWAGQYVMRTDWSPQARYLLFDAGPFGHGHQHEDKLCVDTHAFGQDMVIDPGRYTYAGGKWRTFFVRSESHNVVLVDGGGQRRHARRDTYYADGPMPVTWATGERFDYARGSYDGPFRAEGDPEVAHTRAIWFVKPDYWVVADFLRPADGVSHEYEMLWHFAPGAAEVDGLQARYLGAKAGMLLETHAPEAALEIIEGREDPVQGWVSYDYGLKEPAPVASYRFEGADADAVTALYPFPGGDPPNVEIERVEAAGGVAVRVTHGDGEDVVVFRAPDADEVRWGDYATDAEAFAVRFNADGAVQSVAMAGGTSLTGPGINLQVEEGEAGAEWEG